MYLAEKILLVSHYIWPSFYQIFWNSDNLSARKIYCNRGWEDRRKYMDVLFNFSASARPGDVNQIRDVDSTKNIWFAQSLSPLHFGAIISGKTYAILSSIGNFFTSNIPYTHASKLGTPLESLSSSSRVAIKCSWHSIQNIENFFSSVNSPPWSATWKTLTRWFLGETAFIYDWSFSRPWHVTQCTMTRTDKRQPPVRKEIDEIVLPDQRWVVRGAVPCVVLLPMPTSKGVTSRNRHPWQDEMCS